VTWKSHTDGMLGRSGSRLARAPSPSTLSGKEFAWTELRVSECELVPDLLSGGSVPRLTTSVIEPCGSNC